MDAYFYKTSKKPNSTWIPTGTGTLLSITLLDNCSISTPSIIVSSIGFDYNYVYIPDFGRYYFLSQCIILNNNRYQYNLVVDVLASFRSSIRSASKWVIRSASDWDPQLPDEIWTHDAVVHEAASTVALPDYDSSGCYVVTIVNPENAASANPASTMYCMSPSGLYNLLEEMFDYSKYTNITDWDLTATYFNPFQYITSCRWYPFPRSWVTSSASLIKVKYGWYETTNTYGALVTDYGKRITVSLGTVPENNSNWTDKDQNWHRIALYVPGCGLTEIDPQFSGQTLTCHMDIDFNTGKIFAQLVTGTNQICATLSGTMGAEVSINQIAGQLDIPDSLSGLAVKGIEVASGAVAKGGKSILQTIANFGKYMVAANAAGAGNYGYVTGTQENLQAAGDALISSGREAGKAIAESAMQALLNPTVTSAGADGCRYTIIANHTFIIYDKYYVPIIPTLSECGGMLQQQRTLSNLSGYTVCANGMIDMLGTAEEKNAVASFLEGGFYLA